MAIETKWGAVAPKLFTANGTTLGIVTVASTSGFKVKQVVVISQNLLPDLQLQVKRVTSPTQLIVGPIPTKVGQSLLTFRTDISAYTVAGGAFIYSAEQDKVKIKPDDIEQAIYDQEPTVAMRSVLVDQFGLYYDTVIDNTGLRRLAVDAAVTISGVTVEVDLDAFTKTPPDNAISVGTEDGTRDGIKHAIKIASNGLLQVQDLAAETSLASILAALGSGITVTGTVNVGNFPSVQTVSVNNFPSVQAISGSVTVSGTVAVSNFPATQPISGSVSVSNFPAIQAISATSLPLPTGAATSANQLTEIASLASIDSKITTTVNGIKVDGSAVTQPVSAASLPLPAGAATAAKQDIGNASLGSIDGKLNSLGQKTKAGSVPVTLPSDQDPIPTMILFTKPWDAIAASYPSAAVEVYQSYIGGLSGTLQQTATVTYTDGTKNVLLNVVRT